MPLSRVFSFRRVIAQSPSFIIFFERNLNFIHFNSEIAKKKNFINATLCRKSKPIVCFYRKK